MVDIESIVDQIYRQPFFEGLLNPFLNESLDKLAAAVRCSPKVTSDDIYIVSMALSQPGTDYEISKPLCDAAAHFDFREWTPNDLLYDLRRTEFGTLEASIRLYCLGEKLSKPEANYNFWTENFTPNRLFITKSLAFFYKMNDLPMHRRLNHEE